MGRMPTLFIGHGSPMNAIETNQYTENWMEITRKIPRPEAVLSVSAHWFTGGTHIQDEPSPRMIYDMYGFPKELYEVDYPAAGSPELAHKAGSLIQTETRMDSGWGYDHGTWSVLRKLYPDADIPVFQLSVDRNADAGAHFKIGQELRSLRDEGVLILGSGNVVHNLSKIGWNMEGGYPWAVEFDQYIKDCILKRRPDAAIDYTQAGPCADIAFYSPDHFYPLFYPLGASTEKDEITVFNDSCTMGSLSMTCYLFG